MTGPDPLPGLVTSLGSDTLPPDTLPAQPGYPPTSRYADVPVVLRTLADGRTVRLLRRRLVPPASTQATEVLHEVRPLDRLDTLAAAYLGESRLWWRLADANDAVDPDDLLEPGRLLRIPRPGGAGR